jgi:ribosomal protein L12E/L44/L45/RPP1/RPP2
VDDEGDADLEGGDAEPVTLTHEGAQHEDASTAPDSDAQTEEEESRDEEEAETADSGFWF